MPTQNIDSQPYAVYADTATADLYAAGAIHADAWRSVDADTKARAVVTAARVLDRQAWQAAYDTFDKRVAVQNIVDASIEIAIALVDGSEMQNSTTEQAISSMKAGSVAIEYFRGAEGPVTRFPRIVQELLAPYLGSASASIGSKSFGVDQRSIFPLNLGYTRGL